jgi:hypothetical protein
MGAPRRPKCVSSLNQIDEAKMNPVKTLATAGVLSIVLSSAALASSYRCDAVPQSEWKTTEDARAAMVGQGYEVRKVKAKGGCFEVYVTKDGERFEAFMHPASLEIVKLKQD